MTDTNEKPDVKESSQQESLDIALDSYFASSPSDEQKKSSLSEQFSGDNQNAGPELRMLTEAVADRLSKKPPSETLKDFLNADTAKERREIVRDLAASCIKMNGGNEYSAVSKPDIARPVQSEPAKAVPDIYRENGPDRPGVSRLDIYRPDDDKPKFDIRNFVDLRETLQDISFYDACSRVNAGLGSEGRMDGRATFEGLRRLADIEKGDGSAAKDAAALLDKLGESALPELSERVKTARQHKDSEHELLSSTFQARLKDIGEGKTGKTGLADLERANVRAILQGNFELDFYTKLGREMNSATLDSRLDGYLGPLNKLSDKGDQTAKLVLEELSQDGIVSFDKTAGRYVANAGAVDISQVMKVAPLARTDRLEAAGEKKEAKEKESPIAYDKGPLPLSKLAEMAGINLPAEQMTKLLSDAVGKHGEKEVRDVLARCLAFNSLTAEQRLALSSSTEDLKEGQFLRLDDKPINSATFAALPVELRKQLLGTETMPINIKEVPNLADWKISSREFNALPAHSRRDLTGSTDKIAGGFDLSKVEPLSAESIKRMSPELASLLTGDPGFKADKLSPSEFKVKELSAEQFNNLSDDDRKMLTGTEGTLADGSILSLAGKTEFWAGPGSPVFSQETRHRLTGSLDHAKGPNYPTYTDLSRLSIDHKTYNALPDAVKAKLNCTDDRLDPSNVLRQMASGTIKEADSGAKFLLGNPPLEERISKLQEASSEKIKQLEDTKAKSINYMNAGLKDMERNANTSVGFIGRLFSNHAEEHAKDQQNAVNTVSSNKTNFLVASKEVRAQKISSDALGLAMQNFQHAQALSQGDLRKADLIAAAAYLKHGDSLRYLSPHLHDAIAPGLGNETWKRINGDTTASSSLLVRDPEQIQMLEKSGLKDGLGFLANLKNTGKQQDVEALRAMALKAVDSDPSIQKLSKVAAQLNESLSVMAIGAQSTGTKWESFVSSVKANGQRVEKALSSLTPEELSAVRAQRDVIAESLNKKGEGGISDPESRKALQARLDAINSSLQILDPKEIAKDKAEKQKLFDERTAAIDKELASHERRLANLRHEPPALGRDQEKSADILRDKIATLNKEKESLSNLSKREQLDKLLAHIKKPEFEADTAENWFKREGVVTAVGVVAATAALAAIEVGSFGTATPLVVAVVGTAGFMAGSEVAKEAQFNVGVRSDGALVGNWGREALDSKALADGRYRDWAGETASNFKDKVALPYATELAIGTAMFYCSGKLGQTAMDKVFANQAKQLAMLAAESPAKLTFTEALLNGLKSQLTTPLQMGLEQNAKDVFGNSQETSMAISFALSTMLSAGHRGIQLRAAHAGRAISPDELGKLTGGTKGAEKAGETIKLAYHAENQQSEAAYMRDLEKQGFKVSPTQDGFKMSRDGFTAELVRIDASKKGSLSQGVDNASPNPLQRPMDRNYNDYLGKGVFETARDFFSGKLKAQKEQVVEDLGNRVRDEAVRMGIPKEAADALAVTLTKMHEATGAAFGEWAVNFNPRFKGGEQAASQVGTHEVSHAADAFVNTVLHKVNPELYTRTLVNELGNCIGAGGNVSSADSFVGYQSRARVNVDATPAEISLIRNAFKAQLRECKSLKDIEAKVDQMQQKGWNKMEPELGAAVQRQYQMMAAAGVDLPPWNPDRLSYLTSQVKISLMHAQDVSRNVTIDEGVIAGNKALGSAIDQTAQRMSKLTDENMEKYLQHKLEGVSFSISGRFSKVADDQAIHQNANYNSAPEEMKSFRAQETDNLYMLCKAYDAVSTASKMTNNPEITALYTSLKNSKPDSPEANAILLQLITKVPTDNSGIKSMLKAQQSGDDTVADSHLNALSRQIDESKSIIEHLDAKEQMVRSLVRMSGAKTPQDAAYHQRIMSDAAKKAVASCPAERIDHLKHFINSTNILSPAELNIAIQNRANPQASDVDASSWRLGRKDAASKIDKAKLQEIIDNCRAWDQNRKERVAPNKQAKRLPDS